jgi:hypothetical protein
MRDFRIWLREHLTPEAFQALGGEDARPFDYRTYLRERGVASQAGYDATLKVFKLELRREFLAFQREAAIDFVRELGRVAAAATGHPVPVGINAWNLAPTQLATAHVADYFANEISHYGVEDLEPPRAYLLAEALGKPVFSTGTGEDWIKVMEHGDVIRVRRWIATAQAFGQHFMYAYRKWGFSAETGTRWYETPIDTFAPVFGFVTANPALFDDFEAAPQIGVLYDNAARRAGRGDVAPILRALHDAHYSAGLVVVGDEWLQHPFDDARLARFAALIIPPDVKFEVPQTAALEAWQAQDRTIVWSGIEAIRARVKPWIDVQGANRVWTLPRIRNGPTPARIVIHLLNQQQATDRDAMIATGSFRVSIRRELLRDQPVAGATLFAPDSPPLTLAVDTVADDCEVTVPTLDLWAVLQLK